jgi:hypothetical protein
MSEPLEATAALLHDLRMATTKDEAWLLLQDYGRLAQAATEVSLAQPQLAPLAGEAQQEIARLREANETLQRTVNDQAARLAALSSPPPAGASK